MIGIDIVEVKRIEKAMKYQGFLTKLFTENEREYLRGRGFSVQTVAGMYAAKEAVAKALGTGIAEGIGTQDIEIMHDSLGKPYAVLYRKAQQKMEEKQLSGMELSISHEKSYAVSVCMGRRAD